MARVSIIVLRDEKLFCYVKTHEKHDVMFIHSPITLRLPRRGNN